MTTGDVWPTVPVAGHFDLTRPACRGVDGRGVTRGEVLMVARRWCADRALRPATVTTVAALTGEAVGCGHRVGAQGLSLTMRWVDLDRMRVEMGWHGCAASALTADQALHIWAPRFDELAEGWGVEALGKAESCQWFDVDTRASGVAVGVGHDVVRHSSSSAVSPRKGGDCR